MNNFKKFKDTNPPDFLKDFNSKSKDLRYEVGIDSEYESKVNKPTEFISTQIDDTFYEHPSCKLGIFPTWSDPFTVFVDHFGLAKSYHNPNPPDKKEKVFRLKCYIYFTFADIVACFNHRDIPLNIARQCTQRNIIKARKINQKFLDTELIMVSREGVKRRFYIYIYDTSGFLGDISLEEQVKILNIEAHDKEIVPTETKSEMKRYYCSNPQKFKRYAVFDSSVLHQTTEEYTRFWSKVCNELSVPELTTKQTIGTNTAKLTRCLIEKILFRDCTEKDKERFNQKLNVKTVWKGISKLNEEATISHLEGNRERTSALASLTDGGRCKNERPTDTVAEGVLADIDISSCYGNGLLHLKYPVGRPCIKDYYIGDIANDYTCLPTLGDFLKSKEGNDLVPGLWYARFSTSEDLSFQQDLILTKMPSSRIFDGNNSDSTDNSDFVLLTKEISRATLTSDILEVLQSVCSSREFGELKKKLRIETLVFYPKSMELPTVKELMDNEASPLRTVEFDENYHSNTTDKRSKYWTAVDLSDGWIDTLIEKRKTYPKETPLNEIYKLIINSTYGVLASRYFDCGNVVLASNLTARARVMVWLMAKALGFYQSITDGGLFNLNSVNYYHNDYTPSMNTLCHINRPDQLSRPTRSRINRYPLGKDKWSYNADKGFLHGNRKVDKTLIAQLARKHLNNLFKTDEISILHENQFTFETVDFYKRASFQAQSNYLFTKFDGQMKYEGEDEVLKARGYETKKDLFADEDCTISYHKQYPDRKLHPIKECLINIADNKPVPPFPKAYTQNILKVSQFNHKDYSDTSLLPGDSIPKKTHLRPITVSAFKFHTYEQYKSWLNTSNNTKKYCGFGLEAYFIDENGYFNYQEVVEKIQSLIDDGQSSPFKPSQVKITQDILFKNNSNR